MTDQPDNPTSAADLMALVRPAVASRMGRGRSALLQAHRDGLVRLPTPCLQALTALGHAERARQTLYAADPGLARADYGAKVLAAVRSGVDVPPADEVEVVEMRARLHGIQVFALDQAQQQLHNWAAAQHCRPSLADRRCSRLPRLGVGQPARCLGADRARTRPAVDRGVRQAQRAGDGRRTRRGPRTMGMSSERPSAAHDALNEDIRQRRADRNRAHAGRIFGEQPTDDTSAADTDSDSGDDQ